MALLLVGPLTWVGVSLANSGNSGTLPAAGPTAATAQVGGFPGGGRGPLGGGPPEGPGGFEGPGGAGGLAPPAGGPDANGAAPTASSGNAVGSRVDSALLSFLEANQGSAKYLFATVSSMTAAPYIIETGKPVMALGGFSGSDQILTVSQLQALVSEGQVHYFLLDGGAGGGAGNAALVRWVEAHGTTITAGSVTLYFVSSAAAAGS